MALPRSGDDSVTFPALRLARVFGVARLGLAGVMLARPDLLPRLLGVDRRTASRTSWLPGMVAGREAAVGAASLAAAAAGRTRAALLPHLVADAGDALVLAVALRRGHVSRLAGTLIVLAAAGGAAVEAAGMLRPEG